MRAGLLRLCGAFLLTGIATASVCAQTDALGTDFPLSTGLAPSLTDDPQTAPVTTLSTDLLAPQRPYIFDPSGASVISNALNPEIYSLSVSSSSGETDTQIRDSSQTGQISPYAAAANRLGLGFSGGDDSASQDDPSISDGSFHCASTGEVGNAQSASEDAYRSSWGASSSFVPQSEQSSWGIRRLATNRLGNGQPSSLAATDERGELAAAGDQNGDVVVNAYGDSTSGNITSFRRTPIGSSKGKSTNSLLSRYGGAGTNTAAYGSIDGRAGGAYLKNRRGRYLTGGIAGTGTSNGSTGAIGGTSIDKTDSAKNTLAFFPQAAYSTSSLGESPFSSPGGGGEPQFLNPNIYAATFQGHSLSIGEKGSVSGDSLRQAFVQRHSATNASRYGLNTHPGTGKLTTGVSEKSALERSSHLSTGLLSSDDR
jgi:hypothetical protein